MLTLPHIIGEYLKANPKAGLADQRNHVHSLNDIASIEEVQNVILNSETFHGVIDAIKAHFLTRGLSPATVNRKLSALSEALQWALKRRKTALGSIPKIERMREPQIGRTRVLSKQEEGTVLRLAEPTLGRFIAIAIDTGLRVSEVLKVTSADIDHAQRSVVVWETKGRKPRRVPLTARAYSALNGGPLPIPLDQDRVNYLWSKVRKAMNLQGDAQFVPHVLRHTFCSRLAQLGVSPYVIRDLAGHSNIGVTERYVHFCSQKTAINAVGLLETDTEA